MENSLDPDLMAYICRLIWTGFQQALEIMENLEVHGKKSMHGKIMEFEKN